MNQFFFKINLNKYGELKLKKESEKKTFANTTIAFFVLIAVFVGVTFYLHSIMSEKINNRYKFLKEIKEEIKKYQASGEDLSTKDLERLTSLSTERIFWAKKLVALAEKMDDKIAITHFSFKTDVLSLYGITKMDKNQKEHDLIDSFITKLNQNTQISVDFDDIIFVSSRQDHEKAVEIIRFQIDLVAKNVNNSKSKRGRK